YLAGWMNHRHPVAVKIEPVMVGSAARPWLIKLAAVGIGNQHIFTFMRVCPMRETTQSVRVYAWINQYYGISQKLVYCSTLRRSQIINHSKRGVRATGLVAVHTVIHAYHNRHVIQIKTSRF